MTWERETSTPQAVKGHKGFVALPVETRFWEKVDKSGDCWTWQGHCQVNGYGNFHFNGKTYRSHRAAWMLVVGEIPPGMFVCHHCDNPPCVRPDHLFLGTHADNMADRQKKGHLNRAGGPKKYGESHGRHRLTWDLVTAIRTESARGTQRKVLAERYQVDPSTISLIATGRRWPEDQRPK